jgi:hypothetical protein
VALAITAAVTVGALVTVIPGARASAVSFAPPAYYSAGTQGGPFSDENLMVAGDFRHTGHPDLLIVNFYTQGVTMMLNNGNGTFRTPGIQISIADNIGTLAVGDFNGDGNLDFVADSYTTAHVMLGDGHGNFTQKATYSIQQSGQTDVVVADFNRDGKLDVAVDTPTGVQMLLGKGDGTFTMGPFTQVGTSVSTLAANAVANCNGDGIPDLYVSDVSNNTVYALRGRGEGGFTVAGSGLASIVPGSVYAGQFRTGAGVDDAVALNEFTSPNMSMSYLQSNGNCGFKPAVGYNAGYNIDSGQIGDFDRDGTLDVVSSDTSTSREVFVLGNGKGGFTAGPAISLLPGLNSPQTPVVADLNGDGKPDVVTVGTNSIGQTTIAVLLNSTP